MRIATVVLRPCSLSNIKGDVIGVDSGAWFCYENQIPMILACGDFDSINPKSLQMIQENTPTIVLNPIKDETDFTFALSKLKEYDRIIILGGLGGRRDHEYLIIRTVTKDPRLIVIDDQNKIYSKEKGNYTIEKDDYHYISLFPIKPSKITLEGFKYPLTDFSTVGKEDMLTSNEIIGQRAQLNIQDGSLLIIQS